MYTIPCTVISSYQYFKRYKFAEVLLDKNDFAELFPISFTTHTMEYKFTSKVDIILYRTIEHLKCFVLFKARLLM